MIIGTLVIYNQLKYIQNKDIGYNRNHVLVIKNAQALGKEAEIFKQEIKKLSGVVNATLTGYTPTENNRNSNSLFQDPALNSKNAILTQLWPVDESYISTLGMKMIAGRNFSLNMRTDATGVIINETAAHMLGYKNPINKLLFYTNEEDSKKIVEYHIIGIVKDFNFNSLHYNITPVVMVLSKDRAQ